MSYMKESLSDIPFDSIPKDPPTGEDLERMRNEAILFEIGKLIDELEEKLYKNKFYEEPIDRDLIYALIAKLRDVKRNYG